MSQSSVPDVGGSCGGVHDPRHIVVGDSPGFAEQRILRGALEHDVERAHPLLLRVLFERNDDASDGQMRVTDLQQESDSVLQLGCWGEDVASEAWYNQRAEVDRELGAVTVADGERDDAGTDSIDCVFPGGCDFFGVESSLNSRTLSFSPGISSSSRNDSDALLSTSSVTPLVLGVNRLVAAAVNVKPPPKSLLVPAKLMTGFSLSGDSLSLAVIVVSAVVLFTEEKCAQLAHARETLAFLFGRVAPWL